MWWRVSAVLLLALALPAISQNPTVPNPAVPSLVSPPTGAGDVTLPTADTLDNMVTAVNNTNATNATSDEVWKEQLERPKVAPLVDEEVQPLNEDALEINMQIREQKVEAENLSREMKYNAAARAREKRIQDAADVREEKMPEMLKNESKALDLSEQIHEIKQQELIAKQQGIGAIAQAKYDKFMANRTKQMRAKFLGSFAQRMTKKYMKDAATKNYYPANRTYVLRLRNGTITKNETNVKVWQDLDNPVAYGCGGAVCE